MSKKEKKKGRIYQDRRVHESLSGTRSFVFACRLGNPKLQVVISVCCCRYLIVCLFVPFCLSPHAQAWMITPLPTPAPPPKFGYQLGAPERCHGNIIFVNCCNLQLLVLCSFLSFPLPLLTLSSSPYTYAYTYAFDLLHTFFFPYSFFSYQIPENKWIQTEEAAATSSLSLQDTWRDSIKIASSNIPHSQL